MIQCKILYYKEKLEKDRIRLSKLNDNIEKLENTDPNDIDRYQVKASDRLIQNKIKKYEIQADINKCTFLINSLNNNTTGLNLDGSFNRPGSNPNLNIENQIIPLIKKNPQLKGSSNGPIKKTPIKKTPIKKNTKEKEWWEWE
jgi:hypothetical protein